MRSILLGTAAALLMAATAMGAAPERLVLKPYPATPAWREITNQSEGGGAWIWEFAPANESGPDYPEIVTAQSFPAARTQDPSAFLSSLFARTARACERISVDGPVARTEGGLSVASYWLKSQGRCLQQSDVTPIKPVVVTCNPEFPSFDQDIDLTVHAASDQGQPYREQ